MLETIICGLLIGAAAFVGSIIAGIVMSFRHAKRTKGFTMEELRELSNAYPAINAKLKEIERRKATEANATSPAKRGPGRPPKDPNAPRKLRKPKQLHIELPRPAPAAPELAVVNAPANAAPITNSEGN